MSTHLDALIDEVKAAIADEQARLKSRSFHLKSQEERANSGLRRMEQRLETLEGIRARHAVTNRDGAVSSVQVSRVQGRGSPRQRGRQEHGRSESR